MTTYTLQQQQKTERLTDAFRIFNELSENLAHSYQGLQEQVANLSRELAAARSERLTTLIEKERLASRLQQILAALPAAVVVLNAFGQIIDCNKQAIDFLGEPLLGQSWQTVLVRSLRPVLDTPHERQLRDDRIVSLSRNVLNNDSEQIILLSDVSELRGLQDSLAQQKHLSAMGEMVASLAHQVRTPLATAILYASQLNNPGLVAEKRAQFSHKILERLHYLERQVNDMLIFAKQGRLSMQAFSWQSVLNHLADAMEGYDGVLQIDNQLVSDQWQGNQDAWRGALLNLLNNAREAGASLIRLGFANNEHGDVHIQVQDNGPGFDPHQQAQLFEPFYTTKSNGTGLGLAVVDSVCRAHGGTVACQSIAGQGALFTLNLPNLNQYRLNLSAVSLSEEQHHEAV